MREGSYRETISHTAEAEFTHKKILGGGGEFAKVVIRLEPLERGAGIEFVNLLPFGAIRDADVEGVEEGIRSAARTGVLYGYPVVDFRATLLDGAYHRADSNPHTFSLAAREAFWKAMRNAGPKVLLRHQK